MWSNEIYSSTAVFLITVAHNILHFQLATVKHCSVLPLLGFGVHCIESHSPNNSMQQRALHRHMITMRMLRTQKRAVIYTTDVPGSTFYINNGSTNHIINKHQLYCLTRLHPSLSQLSVHVSFVVTASHAGSLLCLWGYGSYVTVSVQGDGNRCSGTVKVSVDEGGGRQLRSIPLTILVLEWKDLWDLDEVDVMSLNSAIIQFNQVGKLVHHFVGWSRLESTEGLQSGSWPWHVDQLTLTSYKEG